MTICERILKRLLDIVISIIMILMLSPLVLLISILILITIGAPVFYISPRVGRDRRIFQMLKFRSMTNEADENGSMLPDEKRLVSLGRFLRRTSLDELPQLFNVFIGDMTIVGPRPILPHQISLVPQKYHNRFDMRPGLTSWASVNFLGIWRSWNEKLQLDSEYMNNYSLRFDLKIIGITFWALICRFKRYKSGLSPGAEEMEKLK